MSSPEITENIPNEVWFEICQYLGVKDLRQMGQVCRGLSKYAEEYMEPQAKKIQIGSGEAYSLFLIDGNVYFSGSIVDRDNRDQTYLRNRGGIPKLVPDLSNVVKISAGLNHSLAIDNKQNLYAWGTNEHGQLGLGDNKPRTLPTLVGNGFVEVSTCSLNSLAIDNDGNIWSWGLDRLGLGKKVKNLNIPTKINIDDKFKAISVGQYFSLALNRDGKVYIWGSPIFQNFVIYDPEIIPNLDNIIDISSGNNNILALDDQGRVHSISIDKISGQPGYAFNLHKFSKLRNIVKISAGYNYSLVLDDQGQVYSWGDNRTGKLGLEDCSDRRYPTLVSSKIKFVNINAGWDQSLFVSDKGKIYGCGIDYGNLWRSMHDTTYVCAKRFEMDYLVKVNKITQVKL